MELIVLHPAADIPAAVVALQAITAVIRLAAQLVGVTVAILVVVALGTAALQVRSCGEQNRAGEEPDNVVHQVVIFSVVMQVVVMPVTAVAELMVITLPA
jgi:uncharacterized membrane-anchored protein